MMNWSQKLPSTFGLVYKIQYNFDKQNLEKRIEDVDKKIPSTTELIEKTDYNTSVTEIKNKIPNITALVTTAGLNVKNIESENKILYSEEKILKNSTDQQKLVLMQG